MEDRPRNTEDERTGEAPRERFQMLLGRAYGCVEQPDGGNLEERVLDRQRNRW